MGRRKQDSGNVGAGTLRNLSPASVDVNDKMFFATRIKAQRSSKGLTQAELAEKLGLTRAAVNSWENGFSRPDIRSIPALCEALHVNVSDFFATSDRNPGWDEAELRLMNCYRGLTRPHQQFLLKVAADLENMEAEERHAYKEPIRLLRLPLATDEVAAGFGAQGFEDSCTQVYVHNDPKLRDADILFRVNGHSMEPEYPDHSTVYVKKETEIAHGQVGIFAVDGVLYMKRFQEDGLYSFNPDYPVMKPDNYGDIQIIGHVLGIMDDGSFATDEEIQEYLGQN